MQANKATKVQWKIPALIGAVVLGVHAAIISGVLLASGCGTTKPQKVEAPPAPIMPPPTAPAPAAPKQVFTPPVPVEPAPVVKETAEAKSYVVRPGDSLDRIARRFGVSARELAELNGIKNVNVLRTGKQLTLPPYARAMPGGAAPAAHKAPARKHIAKTPPPAAGGATYTVQKNDSLSRIAKRNGVKISALRAANHLTGDMIHVGQKLVIPGKGEGAAPAAPAAPGEGMPPPAAPAAPEGLAPATPAAPGLAVAPTEWTVQEGQTLNDVAKMFLVKQEDILKVNGLTDPASVKPGAKLKIP